MPEHDSRRHATRPDPVKNVSRTDHIDVPSRVAAICIAAVDVPDLQRTVARSPALIQRKPTPGSVAMYRGDAASSPIFCRSFATRMRT